MSFKTLKFTTDWKMFTVKEKLEILAVQADITRSYERHANPDYFKKDLGWYIAQGIKESRNHDKK